MARRLSELTAQLEHNERLKDFLTVAGCIMVSRNGDLTEALGKAVSIGAPERVQRVLKAAVAGASTASVGPDFSVLYDAFLDGVRNVGAFDRIAQFALRMPLRPGRVFLNTSAITGSGTSEAKAKPVRALQLSPEDLAVQKSTAVIVLSKMLIDALDTQGLNARVN
jgi:hypothetical protein